jgi:hypothetical protein
MRGHRVLWHREKSDVGWGGLGLVARLAALGAVVALPMAPCERAPRIGLQRGQPMRSFIGAMIRRGFGTRAQAGAIALYGTLPYTV